MLYIPETKKFKKQAVGKADDILDADGVRILTHDQAVAAAQILLKQMARIEDLIADGEEVHAGPYTVADAWGDYILDAKGRGISEKNLKIYQQTYDAHIGPKLGPLQVSKLSKDRITKWHQGLAVQGKLKTGKIREKAVYMDAPKTDEERRQRRDTANWILSKLKAALNHALDEGKVQEPAPWHLVKAFPNTVSNRVRFLSIEEQQKLVAGCDVDLRPLVKVGLYSGARYGELTRVIVRDFDPLNKTLFIAFGKGRGAKSRTVKLTRDGVAFLNAFTADRDRNELMFLRTDVKRRGRKGTLANPSQWADYDQKAEMENACKTSGVARVTFHELRHTYASYLLNEGMNLSYLARQLGHADLRMVTRFYGHIAEEAMNLAIDSLPSQNLDGQAT